MTLIDSIWFGDWVWFGDWMGRDQTGLRGNRRARGDSITEKKQAFLDTRPHQNDFAPRHGSTSSVDGTS
jgi:hypothetical protein